MYKFYWEVWHNKTANLLGEFDSEDEMLSTMHEWFGSIESDEWSAHMGVYHTLPKPHVHWRKCWKLEFN